MKKKNKKTATTGFDTQAISIPDRREEKSRVALPDDKNVETAREFIIENKK